MNPFFFVVVVVLLFLKLLTAYLTAAVLHHLVCVAHEVGSLVFVFHSFYRLISCSSTEAECHIVGRLGTLHLKEFIRYRQ